MFNLYVLKLQVGFVLNLVGVSGLYLLSKSADPSIYRLIFLAFPIMVFVIPMYIMSKYNHWRIRNTLPDLPRFPEEMESRTLQFGQISYFVHDPSE